MVLLLLFTICIQTVDLLPALSDKHTAYTQEFSSDISTFKSDAWQELGENATEIIFYPPTNYLVYCNPELSCRFAEFALEYDLRLNITYMSRDLSQQADAKTKAHFEARTNEESFPDIIYVFGETFDKPAPELVGLNYYMIDGYIIGTERDLSHHTDITPYVIA